MQRAEGLPNSEASAYGTPLEHLFSVFVFLLGFESVLKNICLFVLEYEGIQAPPFSL